MSDNHVPFVVIRPDGFVGVEVGVSDQLTPSEARGLARKLASCADRADKLARLAWPRRVATVTSAYVFRVGVREIGGDAWMNSVKLESLLLRHRVTHVDSKFGDDGKSPESPRRGVQTRDSYLRWWRTGEEDE